MSKNSHQSFGARSAQPGQPEETAKPAVEGTKGPEGPKELPDTSKPDGKPETVNGAGAPSAGGQPEETAKPAVEIKHDHQVAPGRSISCDKGIIDQGQQMKAEWLGKGDAGVKALDNLVAKGYVLKRSGSK